MRYANNPRALLLGLLSSCPFSEVDADCPLAEVRSEDVPEMKTLAFNRLSDSQVERIIDYHRHCESVRDNPLKRNLAKTAQRPEIRG